MLLLYTVFIHEIHMFVQFSCIGIFYNVSVIVIWNFREEGWRPFRNSFILLGSQCARYTCFQCKWFYYKRCTSFYNSPIRVYFEQSECFCHLKTLRGRKFSYQKLSLFIKGNNVQGIPCSTINCFLPSYALLSWIQYNRPMLNKVNVSASWNPWETDRRPYINCVSSPRETMHKTLMPLTYMLSFQKIHVFLQFRTRGLFCTKWMIV
jgi:hypothetical protein